MGSLTDCTAVEGVGAYYGQVFSVAAAADEPFRRTNRTDGRQPNPTEDLWAACIVSHNSEFNIRRTGNPADVNWYNGAMYWWAGASAKAFGLWVSPLRRGSSEG